MKKTINKYLFSGKAAVDVVRVFEKCVDIANDIGKYKINFEMPDETVLIHADLNKLTAQIIMMLESVVMNGGDEVLKLSIDNKTEDVYVDIDCDGIFNRAYFEFKRYIGTPSYIVSDALSDYELEAIIIECFAKNKYFGKVVKGYEKNRE